MASVQEVQIKLNNNKADRENIAFTFDQLTDNMPEITDEMVGVYLNEVKWYDLQAKKVLGSKDKNLNGLKKAVAEEQNYAKSLSGLYNDKLKKGKLPFNKFKEELKKINAAHAKAMSGVQLPPPPTPMGRGPSPSPPPRGSTPSPPPNKPMTESQEMAEIMKQIAEQERLEMSNKPPLSAQSRISGNPTQMGGGKPMTESQEMADIMRQIAEQEAKEQMQRSNQRGPAYSGVSGTSGYTPPHTFLAQLGGNKAPLSESQEMAEIMRQFAEQEAREKAEKDRMIAAQQRSNPPGSKPMTESQEMADIMRQIAEQEEQERQRSQQFSRPPTIPAQSHLPNQSQPPAKPISESQEMEQIMSQIAAQEAKEKEEQSRRQRENDMKRMQDQRQRDADAAIQQQMVRQLQIAEEERKREADAAIQQQMVKQLQIAEEERQREADASIQRQMQQTLANVELERQRAADEEIKGSLLRQLDQVEEERRRKADHELKNVMNLRAQEAERDVMIQRQMMDRAAEAERERQRMADREIRDRLIAPIMNQSFGLSPPQPGITDSMGPMMPGFLPPSEGLPIFGRQGPMLVPPGGPPPPLPLVIDPLAENTLGGALNQQGFANLLGDTIGAFTSKDNIERLDNKRMKEMSDILSRNEAEIYDVRSRINLQKDMEDQLKGKLSGLRNLNTFIKNDIDHLNKSYQENKHERESLTCEVSMLERDLLEIEKEINELKAKNNAKVTSNDDLRTERAVCREKLQVLDMEIERYKSSYVSLKKKWDDELRDEDHIGLSPRHTYQPILHPNQSLDNSFSRVLPSVNDMSLTLPGRRVNLDDTSFIRTGNPRDTSMMDVTMPSTYAERYLHKDFKRHI